MSLYVSCHVLSTINNNNNYEYYITILLQLYYLITPKAKHYTTITIQVNGHNTSLIKLVYFFAFDFSYYYLLY